MTVALRRAIITPANEAHWLAERAKDLTSTECAALFNASPYATHYELWHQKTGALENTFVDNDRTKWGRRLEASIAAGIAEDHGLVVVPFKDYMRIEDVRMGASFDYRIVELVPGFTGESPFRDLFMQRGPGLMEVKNVDGLQFKRGWIDDEEREAPAQIEFQVQHQMEVADISWTVLAPLVGGNTPMPFARLRDLEVGELIRKRVAAFWDSIAKDVPPEPDFSKDAATVAALYVGNDGSQVNLADNERLFELCIAYKDAAKRADLADGDKQAAKAEILTIVGAAEKIIAGGGFSISAGTVAASEGTLITASMVGTRYGGRKSYRNVRINAPKTSK